MLNLPPQLIISRLITLVVALTIHEFAHAWVATRYGDSTPGMNGRLTLNPLAHLDVLGSLMLIFAGFGWAKPVPVSPYALRKRSHYAFMWVSLAGPLSNLALAILAAVLFRLGLAMIDSFVQVSDGILPTPAQFLFDFITINLALLLFNLIPIAPLDGEKVATTLLPPPISTFFENIRPYGPIILLVVVFVLPYVGIDILGLLLGNALGSLRAVLIGI